MAKNTKKAVLAEMLKKHDSILDVDLRKVKFEPSNFCFLVETLCIETDELHMGWLVENKDTFLGPLAFAAFRFAYALDGINKKNYTEFDDHDPMARDDLSTMLENSSNRARMVDNPAQTLLYAAGQARIEMGCPATPNYAVSESDIEWLIGDGHYTSKDVSYVNQQVENEVLKMSFNHEIDLNDEEGVKIWKTARRRELLAQKEDEAKFKYSHASLIISVMHNEDLILTQPSYNGANWEARRDENIRKHVDQLAGWLKRYIIPGADQLLMKAHAESAKYRATEIMAFVKNLSAWAGIDADEIITDLAARRAKIRKIGFND